MAENFPLSLKQFDSDERVEFPWNEVNKSNGYRKTRHLCIILIFTDVSDDSPETTEYTTN